jgi:hypothetical protein
MKTISDIKLELEAIDGESKTFSQEASDRACKLFEDIPEINKLLVDLEMMRNGEYSIDESGELIYSIEVPKEIADLPFINDYLTKDYAFLTGKKHNDLRIAQCCGEFISVDWNHERDCYFVFDHESRKAIIEKRLEWMDERYTAAMIELYQHNKGIFGDVIEINSRYGWYEKHFDTFEALGIKSELTKDDLERIIKSYNSEVEDE